MEKTDTTASSGTQPGDGNATARAPLGNSFTGTELSPKAPVGICRCGSPGGSCICSAAESNSDDRGAMTYAYVYALGRIEPRFPRLSVEKEFAQATGRAETAGLTDRQALHRVLSQQGNRYLVKQLCWVLTIEAMETYILQPRDALDFAQLIEALRSTPSPMDVDVVIGVRGPIAPPELCNGLTVPIVAFDQLYSFDREALVKSIPRPEKMAAKQFETAAAEVFERILQIADNAGA